MTVYAHEARWPQVLIAAPAPVSTRWAHNLTGMNEKPADDIEKLTALLRRALIRLSTVEQRLAALEERQHDLDDMAEQIRGMQALVKRSTVDMIRGVAGELIKEKIGSLDGRIDSRLDKRLGRIERTGRLPGGRDTSDT